MGMNAKSVYNFNPGPAVLPAEVLEQARGELLDYQGSGMSVLELSHRSKLFESLLAKTEADLRALMSIPDSHKVLFQQGGASLQFAMLPLNLRPDGVSADYIVNGAWGKAAFKDAQRLGQARVAGSTEDSGFDRVSPPESLDLNPGAAYLHFTSNETIHGVELREEPVPPPDVPLVCDMSSDILSKPVEVSKYGLIYAGAQKNAGPAGVTIVILREDLLERVPSSLPVMLSYAVQVAGGSMHNTPPCFSIYMVGLVLEWLRNLGGVEQIARRNRVKADLVYAAIDHSGGFYRGHAQVGSRSMMNVTFRLPTEQLEVQFSRDAEGEGFVGLKGHRSVGGIRASLYNALPVDAVEALVGFMAEFQRKNG